LSNSSNTNPIKGDLARVREWASAKIQAGSEPPWAWYQYMKLVETIDAIGASMAATTTENSLRLAERQGNILQLAVATCPQDSAQPHPDRPKIPLPM